MGYLFVFLHFHYVCFSTSEVGLHRQYKYESCFFLNLILFIFPFIFIGWRLITLQYCSGFCHTLTWISHGFTCIPHPDPSSHLPPHLVPLGLPSAPALSTSLKNPNWAGDLYIIKSVSWFCIHSASVCLLVGAFNPFIFKLIIDTHVPSGIFLIVWICFCRSFTFLMFPA